MKKEIMKGIMFYLNGSGVRVPCTTKIRGSCSIISRQIVNWLRLQLFDEGDVSSLIGTPYAHHHHSSSIIVQPQCRFLEENAIHCLFCRIEKLI